MLLDNLSSVGTEAHRLGNLQTFELGLLHDGPPELLLTRNETRKVGSVFARKGISPVVSRRRSWEGIKPTPPGYQASRLEAIGVRWLIH